MAYYQICDKYEVFRIYPGEISRSHLPSVLFNVKEEYFFFRIDPLSIHSWAIIIVFPYQILVFN
jgi:hypothetical protein|uniref:ORF63c n=1 Tax=Pinus koraiensis TaxID=88728 RepID=A4QM43_PINKO|nr:ORF63c [Pinus koraiensis]ABP35379.1 ORF63c [Pinus koraiensis]